MNVELTISIISAIGALISMIAAVAAFRREEIKSTIEQRKFSQEEQDRRRRISKEVAEDTVGLYRKLAAQYQEMNEKDKKLLQTITFVIRKMIILERTVADLMSEMEIQWELHEQEAQGINCPFYDTTSDFMRIRVEGMEEIIRETMAEIDQLLLNGHTDQE